MMNYGDFSSSHMLCANRNVTITKVPVVSIRSIIVVVCLLPEIMNTSILVFSR